MSGRSRGHAVPRPLVPASPALSDVNMAFVSQGAAAVFSGSSPPRHRAPSPADARDEERARLLQPLPGPGTAGTAAGAGSPSRAAAFYHQQSPAPAGKGTARCPQATDLGRRAGELGPLRRSSQSAACPTPGQGEAARTGLQGGVRSRSLAPVPDRARVSVPSWGRVAAPPGATSARQEEEGAEPGCADSAEPRPAEINKEAGDRVRSRPVPNAPGLPLQP